MARAAASAQTFEFFSEHRRHIIENADVAKIWRDGLAGRDLDEIDRTRFEHAGEGYIFGLNAAFNLGRAAGVGKIVEDMPSVLAQTMHDGPGMRTIWKRFRMVFTTGEDSSFGDAVETAAEALAAQSQDTEQPP